MPGINVFSDLNCPYNDRMVDSAFIQENTDQKKPVLWYILRGCKKYSAYLHLLHLKDDEICHYVLTMT